MINIMKFRYLPLLLTASLALPFVACDDDDFEDPEFITASSVSADGTLDLKVGDTKNINVTITPAEATARGINWVSSDKSIATVNGSGAVSAVKVGTATITGTTAEGKTVTCKVTVSPATIVFSLNDKPLFEKDKDDNTHIYHKNSTVVKELCFEINELTPIDDFAYFKTLADITETDYISMIEDKTKYFAGWSTSFDGEPIASTFKKKYGEIEVEMFYEACKQDTLFAVWKSREIVDYGFSDGVQWSSINLGAKGLQDLGNKYAWGEKSTKDNYNWDNYAWGTLGALFKYNDDPSLGAWKWKLPNGKDSISDQGYTDKDQLTELTTDDDPAFAKGYNWRTPTVSQFNELFGSPDKCVYQRETNFNFYGVAGWVIYKKDAGKGDDVSKYLRNDVYETEMKDGKEVTKEVDGKPVIKTAHDPWIFVPDGTYWTIDYASPDFNYAASYVVGANSVDNPGDGEKAAFRCEGYSVRAVLNK